MINFSYYPSLFRSLVDFTNILSFFNPSLIKCKWSPLTNTKNDAISVGYILLLSTNKQKRDIFNSLLSSKVQLELWLCKKRDTQQKQIWIIKILSFHLKNSSFLYVFQCEFALVGLFFFSIIFLLFVCLSFFNFFLASKKALPEIVALLWK